MAATSPQTREQRWAQVVFDKVQAAEQERWKEDYGRQCVHLPALIHQCGLCQTLAFLEAKAGGKGREYCRRLLDDLRDALERPGGAGKLIEYSRSVSLEEYQRVSRNALRCAEWFKRYAEALLKVDVAEKGGVSG